MFFEMDNFYNGLQKKSFNAISGYIINNPLKWDNDKLISTNKNADNYIELVEKNMSTLKKRLKK